MKFYCDRLILTEAVLNVQKAVSSKSTMPALEGILIQTNENSITLSAYDLELGITTTIPATITTPGSIVVNAKLFSEIIRRMPDPIINTETDEKFTVYLTSGKVDYKIMGINAAEFPELPIVKGGDEISISSNQLKNMIRQTIYAIADTEITPAHKGSLFEISNKEIKIISVDGRRLAIRKEPINSNIEKSFIVPGKSLNEVLKLLKDDEKPIQIVIGDRHIIFKVEDYAILTRLIDGEFMNYKAAIPKSFSTELKVNTRKFIDTIDRMSLLLTDKIKSPIRCKVEGGLIKTSCLTSLGQAYDEFEVENTGSDVEIGLNNKFILDALKNTETDEVKIQMNGPLSPLTVLPINGDSFIFLVLPVRLKNEN